MPVKNRRAKKLVGKPRNTQGNQQKRSKTDEDKTRNAYNGRVEQNCRDNYQTDSNLGAPGRKKKDEGMEINCYAKGCTRVTSN